MFTLVQILCLHPELQELTGLDKTRPSSTFRHPQPHIPICLEAIGLVSHALCSYWSQIQTGVWGILSLSLPCALSTFWCSLSREISEPPPATLFLGIRSSLQQSQHRVRLVLPLEIPRRISVLREDHHARLLIYLQPACAKSPDKGTALPVHCETSLLLSPFFSTNAPTWIMPDLDALTCWLLTDFFISLCIVLHIFLCSAIITLLRYFSDR